MSVPQRRRRPADTNENGVLHQEDQEHNDATVADYTEAFDQASLPHLSNVDPATFHLNNAGLSAFSQYLESADDFDPAAFIPLTDTPTNVRVPDHFNYPLYNYRNYQSNNQNGGQVLHPSENFILDEAIRRHITNEINETARQANEVANYQPDSQANRLVYNPFIAPMAASKSIFPCLITGEEK